MAEERSDFWLEQQYYKDLRDLSAPAGQRVLCPGCWWAVSAHRRSPLVPVGMTYAHPWCRDLGLIGKNPPLVWERASGRKRFTDRRLWELPDKPHYGYSRYIYSVEWKSKREEVFARYGRHCSVPDCKSPSALQVDHLDYARLGDEPLEDLLPLCKTHHRRVTVAREKADARPGEGYRRVTEELFGIKVPRPAMAS